MSANVECHSGYSYADRPVALTWQGQRLAITAILERWRTPDGSSFRVGTEDDREFILSYSEQDDRWHIQET
ncbi:MAG: hypothetical protein ABIJ39_03555 [Chloroflexota bacterium]